MPATIRDVARLAGVGVGTVSRVLNNHPSVSDETRQRILTAIATLDYQPNLNARRLSLQKTLTIAVVVPFITTASVTERLRGIIAGVEGTDYDLVIYNVESVDHRDRYFRQVPHRGRVDGLIIVSLTPSDEDIERFRRAGIPTVLVDARHPRLPHVIVDDVRGGQMATETLVGLGHQRIAFLGDRYPNPFHFTSSYHRYLGYTQALDQARIPQRQDYVVTGEHSRGIARTLAHELLALPEPPTAIFAASDTQAIGALAAAQERSVRVPEDLSVIGYDDLEIATYLGLTTVHQPLFESGTEGIALLFAHMEDPDASPTQVVLPLRVEVRQTTAPPAV